MNILFLDQFSEMGGAQQTLVETIRAVCQRGWQSWAAIPPAGPLISRLESLGVTVADVPCGPYQSGTKRIGDVARFVSDTRRQTRVIGELMNRVRFDMLYVNGPRLLPAAALTSPGRVPVLFHTHSHVEQFIARKLAGRCLRRSSAALVGCSHFVVDQFRDCVAAEKRVVIPNGIRELPFRQHKFPREGRWRIGMIGRISPEKGQVEFVRTAALLQVQFPDVKFVVCGAPMFGDKEYFNRVQRLAQGLPIEFLGWRDDIGAVFSTLDLLVVPSKAEGMGRVIVEAYSAGVPVVAFPTGGIPEVVANRETGFLVYEATAEALAGVLREIMRGEPAELRRIGDNARRAWETRYRIETYQERITALMERLASGRATERETEARLLHK